jgi:hypothetical protein
MSARHEGINELRGCACRWNVRDDRVATCKRHKGWLDVVHEFSERARDAERRLETPASSSPVAEPCVITQAGEEAAGWQWRFVFTDGAGAWSHPRPLPVKFVGNPVPGGHKAILETRLLYAPRTQP